jgi:hypothetical protein
MDISTALSLVTTAAVVCGVAFAGFELRIARRQRAREAELLLARSYQTPEFMRALDLVIELPDGLTKVQLEARGPEVMTLIGYWCGSMESIGVLAHEGEIGLPLVEDFFSGPIALSWQKLEPYITERRRLTKRETMHEWFQWLAEQIAHREAARRPIPAHIEYGRNSSAQRPAAEATAVPDPAPSGDIRSR